MGYFYAIAAVLLGTGFGILFLDEITYRVWRRYDRRKTRKRYEQQSKRK